MAYSKTNTIYYTTEILFVKAFLKIFLLLGNLQARCMPSRRSDLIGGSLALIEIPEIFLRLFEKLRLNFGISPIGRQFI